MDPSVWTERGLELEGPLRMVVEDDLVLVMVGEEFLDDALESRFGELVQRDEGRGARSLELGWVRLVVEWLDAADSSGGLAEIEQLDAANNQG